MEAPLNPNLYGGGGGQTPSQSHCFTQAGKETFLREAPCASLAQPCGPGLACGQLSESACKGGRGGGNLPPWQLSATAQKWLALNCYTLWLLLLGYYTSFGILFSHQGPKLLPW